MDEHAQQLRIEVQDVDHLGIVAGIVDEIGLVEEIDRQLGTHPQEHLSCGQAVKAMILNGLGFLSAPLYLFEEFFVGKATEHLIGTGIRPQHLNDDKLGRVLDKLFESDLSEVFVGVAMKAAGERLHRRLERREWELDRELSRLGRKTFACRADAREATEASSTPNISASTTGSPIRRSLR